jgi:hypothetical protein
VDTGSFSGVKRPGRGIDHPPLSSTDVKERVELYLYYTSGPSWPVLGGTVLLLVVAAVTTSYYQHTLRNTSEERRP